MISPGIFLFFQNFDFSECCGVKGQKIPQNDKKFSLSCLMSQELYIIWLSFEVHKFKMITSLVFFSFFQNFHFLGCKEGQRATNGLKWQKTVAPYISGTICHMISINGTHIKKDISRYFLHFFQVLIFGVNNGVKGQKMAQNDKGILSFPLHISGSIHHMIVIFGTPVWNNDISRCFFHFFKILILWVVRWVKGQKMAQNDKKFCLSHSKSQESYLIWLWFFVHMCKMMISSAIFFIFSKFWFFGFLEGGKKEKNDSQLPISVCHTLYLKNCRSYH